MAMERPAEGPGAPARGALVIAADEETRVLLRGLLRLHRCRIVGEAEGARTGIELLRQQRPDLAVVDAALADGDLSGLIREGRQARPGLWVVAVTGASRSIPPAEPEASPDVVLVRPFRIRQFAEALIPPTGG